MTNILQDGEYASDIQSGGHGDRFQKDAALALFLRMRGNNSNFRLGYEVKAADKFDDIVLIDDGNQVIHCIQLKHGIVSPKDGNATPIGIEALFPARKGKVKGKGNFEISKYLESYIVAQKNFSGTEYTKKFYILSNKSLNITDNDWVTIDEHKDEKEMLWFSGFKDRPLKVTPKQGTTEALMSQVNSDISEIKEAIKNLFLQGQVGETLKKYCTPLKNVLQIDGNKQCSFSETFREGNSLFDILMDDGFDMSRTVQVETNFLQNDSKLKYFPPYASEKVVQAFFNDFGLLVGQPHDLRPVIDNELQKWLRTWVQPDTLGKMTRNDMDQLYYALENSFEERIRSKENERRPLLTTEDANKCLAELRNANEKREPEDPEELADFYINRRVIYKERVEKSVDGTSKIFEAADDANESSKRYTQTVDHSITDTQFVEELPDKFKDQQCIVLVADPGMGKTSLLNFLAFEVQRKYDFHVFLLYFNGLVRALDRVDKLSNLEEVLSVLEAVLSKESCDIIRKAPDQRSDGGISVFLALDGFDEIHAKYTTKVISMLKFLQTKLSIQMMISSRVHTRQMLENEFGVQSMFLEPFSGEDQIDYLRKRWNVSSDADQGFEVYSQRLLENFLSSIPSNLSEICGLPLMMRMLAAIQQKNFEKYLAMVDRNPGQQFDLLADNLNVVQLYERFIQKCFQHKFVEKSGNDYNEADLNSMVEGYIFEHQLLALKLLDIELDEKLFRNPSNQDKYRQFRRRCEQESEKSLLVKVVQGVVQFCHLSYAEYFVAKYICDNIYSLQEDRVLKVLNERDVIRKLAFIMLDRDARNFAQIDQLCRNGFHVALWACESGCYDMISSLEAHLKSCSFFDLDLMLRESAKHGYVKICKLLLDNKANPNGRDSEYRTPLHLAVRNSHVTVVELLLQRNADTEAENSDEQTALFEAAKKGNIQIIQTLLNAGAKTNVFSHEGTPFHVAAWNGNKDAVVLFIRYKCDVNITDVRKCTPLHLAARNGHVTVVEALIQHGADVNALTDDGSSALHMAAEGGNTQVILSLIKAGVIANSRTNKGRTPLHVAALNGNKDALALLMGHNNDVHAVDTRKFTALHLAARGGNVQIIQSLITAGAITNCLTSESRTPLHIAAFNGHRKAAEIFIAHKNDVTAMDNYNHTVLHLAAQGGNVQIIQSLIALGANTNSRTNNGKTPLHIAAEYGHKDAVEVFIAHKSDVNAEDDQGMTALQRVASQHQFFLDEAAKRRNIQIIQLLLAEGAITNSLTTNRKTLLHIAAERGNKDVVEIFINRNIDVNARDNEQLTALHLAADEGNVQIIQSLIAKGATTNSRTTRGRTPLHFAAENGNKDAVVLLLDHKIDVNAVDSENCTALHLATRNDHGTVVQLLLPHYTDVNVRDVYGMTPLQLAAETRNAELVQSFIAKGAITNSRTNDGKTVLHIAAENCDKGIVELCLDHNIDVNAVDNEKCTALHRAIQSRRVLDFHGPVVMVELLLRRHAKANSSNKIGWTPLHMAAMGAKDKRKFLGRPPYSKAWIMQYCCTFTRAHWYRHFKTRELSINQNRLSTALQSAGYHNSPFEEDLLNHDPAYGNARDRNKLVSESGMVTVRIIQSLIAAGATTNSRTKDGKTPLHIAAEYGEYDAVELLLSHNVDINATDKEKCTALHLAARESHDSVIKLLLHHHANVNVLDVYGMTDLHLIAKKGIVILFILFIIISIHLTLFGLNE